MIRVNLSGAPRKKRGGGGAPAGPAAPSSALPLLLILIVAATGAVGFWWYSHLNGQIEDMNRQLTQAHTELDKLTAVIKLDRTFEARKKALEARIKVIEGLKRGQVSPVRSLDLLDDAIDKTRFVWLSSLDQNNAVFSMSGTGTSVNAIADFVSNLEATGYFRNINLQNAQDASGNYTFSMTCEFVLPVPTAKEAN
jgi:type IV pilus assembly protein PilN